MQVHPQLDMLGYDMSWASFHIVEVMSSPRIHLKSIGYLAAGLSFHDDTDVLMLTTNSLKKVRSTALRLLLLIHHLLGPQLKSGRCCCYFERFLTNRERGSRAGPWPGSRTDAHTFTSTYPKACDCGLVQGFSQAPWSERSGSSKT